MERSRNARNMLLISTIIGRNFLGGFFCQRVGRSNEINFGIFQINARMLPSVGKAGLG